MGTATVVEVGNPKLPHSFADASGQWRTITGTIWNVYDDEGRLTFRQGYAVSSVDGTRAARSPEPRCRKHFWVVGQLIEEAPQTAEGARRAGTGKRKIARSCGINHVFIYYGCLNEAEMIREGSIPYQHDPFRPPRDISDETRWQLRRNRGGWTDSMYTELQYGAHKGTACDAASDDMIIDCLRSTPNPGDYDYINNNCQQHVHGMLGYCCLEGYYGMGLTSRDKSMAMAFRRCLSPASVGVGLW
jgi:hypothetical protein